MQNIRKKAIATVGVLLVAVFALLLLVSCGLSPSEDIETFTRGTGDKLTVGVVSDIQLPDAPTADGYRYEQNLYRALSFYKDKETDVVMIAGDFTDLPSKYAYQSFQRVWNSVFEKDIDESKKPVKAFIMGNHDYWSPYGEALSANGAGKRFLEYTGEEPWSHKIVNGYHFISCSADSGEYYESHKSTIPWLEKQLEIAKADDPDGGKPIFVQTHYHPKDTVYGSSENDAWWTNYIREVFEKYPNVINFSGHSHYSLTDQRSIFQADGGFTALQTQSLSYIELENFTEIRDADGELAPKTYGKENAQKGAEGYEMGYESTIPEKWEDNPAGLLLTVGGSRVGIKRVSFGESSAGVGLGADWDIDFSKPAGERNLYTTAKVLAERAKWGAPVKQGDALIEQVELDDGGVGIAFDKFIVPNVDEDSPYASSAFVHTYAVKFLNDASTGNSVVFDIKINAKGDTQKKSEFYYYSDFYAVKKDDRKDDRIVLKINPQIPKGTYNIIVTAIDSYGYKTAGDMHELGMSLLLTIG